MVTESKLSQRNKQGNAQYTLAQLLAEPPKPGQTQERKKLSRAQMIALGVPVTLEINPEE